MRREPDTVERESGDHPGFGAGVDTDPAVFEVGEHAIGWTHGERAEKLITDFNVRCAGIARIHGSDSLTRSCNSLLALRVTRPYTLVCRKCKHETRVEVE